MIDICICTHSPDPQIIEGVLQSIVAQDVSRKQFRVIIVDNRSAQAITVDAYPYSLLRGAGIKTQVVREPRLGVARARVKALRVSKAAALVFVDDDNVLSPDFVRNALKILKSHPRVGCFSGRILPPEGIVIPKWVEPLMNSFAIRNCGMKSVTGMFRGDWEPWMPTAAASMVLRRKVADRFLRKHARNSKFYKFGRKGFAWLNSGEDFLIALSASEAGYYCGYFPKLLMWHHIRAKRFSFAYIARLMGAYGTTDLLRSDYLGQDPEVFNWAAIRFRLLLWKKRSLPLKTQLCLLTYQSRYVVGMMARSVASGKSPIRL